MQIELSRAYFDREPVNDLGALIERYPIGEFESPFRSTVPLMSLVRDGQTVLQEVLAECEFTTEADLHFEFKVKPPIGRGKESHTDLMVCAGPACMAVEAEWTEPPYATVGNWLGPTGKQTKNRQEVIAGWLSLIQPFSARTVSVEDVASVAYQTIHRAASACGTAAKPQLPYLQFVSEGYGGAAVRDKRIDDLGRLRQALGQPDEFPFRLIEIDIKPTAEFEQVAMFKKGSPETAVAVRHALLSSTLFTFEALRMHLLP